ncbi:hypothetical protein B0H11DRAFT_1922376 [Mycena galericulata]|nr:hypothetical protein B0H11DRAFT_1922376 [Mycena galericulata]
MCLFLYRGPFESEADFQQLDRPEQNVPCDTLKSLDILPGRSAPLGVVGVVADDGGDGSFDDAPLDTFKNVVLLPGRSMPLGVVGVGAGDGGDGIYEDVPWDTLKSVVLLLGRSRPLGVVGVGAGDGGDGIYEDVPWDTFKSLVRLTGHSRPLGVVGVGAGDGGDGIYEDVPWDTFKSVVLVLGRSRPLRVVSVGAGVGAGDGGDGIYEDVPWDTFKSVVLLLGRSRPLGVVGVGAGDGGDGIHEVFIPLKQELPTRLSLPAPGYESCRRWSLAVLTASQMVVTVAPLEGVRSSCELPPPLKTRRRLIDRVGPPLVLPAAFSVHDDYSAGFSSPDNDYFVDTGRLRSVLCGLAPSHSRRIMKALPLTWTGPSVIDTESSSRLRNLAKGARHTHLPPP